MSSFEKVSPDVRPRFLSQMMAQKLPEKKMPSTHAKVRRRSTKGPGTVDPAEGPNLALQATAGIPNWKGLRLKEGVLLGRVLDVALEEESVRLGVDVLDGDLGAVESASVIEPDLLNEVDGEFSRMIPN
ncbi:hypothetical protein NL676_038342 [Syzygium grande]|nr:hypothetical protein NL676_038342 [Syzygium grande]